MKRKRRTYYTVAQKTEMWDRWQKGETFTAIGRHFDTSHSAISRIIWSTDGIRPLERKRSQFTLTLSEREEISRGLVAHLSFRSIAMQLGRSPSTISREVNRNGGLKHYRATQADQAAWDRAHRPKPCKLVVILC